MASEQDGVVQDGLISGSINIGKACKHCNVDLTAENAAKKNVLYYRKECKPCRSKIVSKSFVGNDNRKRYMNAYTRLKGIVKQYPCEGCSTLCYKKYAKSFCSDTCRFMSYVAKEYDCWMWVGAKNRKGYGKLSFNGKKAAIASRVAYELFKGPISSGMIICHKCDIPSCVNPDHLWAGTHVENMLDMIDKGRQHSKLSIKDVMDIRKLWKQGLSNAKLCEKFKVHSGTISNITNRRIRKFV